jgi:hypothetical protein
VPETELPYWIACPWPAAQRDRVPAAGGPVRPG